MLRLPLLEDAVDSATPGSSAPLHAHGPSSSTGQQQLQQDDPGMAVPVTLPREYVMVDSPRTPPASRPAEDASAVRIAYKEYFTMDDYSTEVNMDDDVER